MYFTFNPAVKTFPALKIQNVHSVFAVFSFALQKTIVSRLLYCIAIAADEFF